jgi:hypothetical protein
MNETNTIENAARDAGQIRKLVAHNPQTGRYFNGTNFDGIKSQALALRPGTTAEDFRWSWACPVEIVELIEVEDVPATVPAKSSSRIYADHYFKAVMEHSDPVKQARLFVTLQKRDAGVKVFSVRMGKEKLERKVSVNANCAFVRIHGQDVALVLNGGELVTDREVTK